jgi:hypothetical protein
MCGTPAILSSRVGALEVIAPRAKFTFDPDDVPGLRAAIERAARSLAAGQRASAADLLYNASVSSHIDILLHLVRRVRYGEGEGRLGDAA